MVQRTTAVVTMAVGAIVTVGGSLLPWVRTGDARRNSYDVFALVGRLGFAPDGPAAVALRWWPLVPLVVAAAVVLAWWGRPRSGGGIGVAAAIYAGGVGLAVSGAPGAGGYVEIELGAPLTAIGAAVLLTGSVACVVIAARSTSPTDLAR